MIVDDDEDAHYLLGRTLQAAGLENPIVSAVGGEEALDHFQKCLEGTMPWPGVIFLDIKMSGINGFQVLRWLREREALGKTVVAMMTTSDDPKDVSQAFTLGAHTYLNKGIKPDILGPIVNSALKLAARKSTSV